MSVQVLEFHTDDERRPYVSGARKQVCAGGKSAEPNHSFSNFEAVEIKDEQEHCRYSTHQVLVLTNLDAVSDRADAQFDSCGLVAALCLPFMSTPAGSSDRRICPSSKLPDWDEYTPRERIAGPPHISDRTSMAYDPVMSNHADICARGTGFVHSYKCAHSGPTRTSSTSPASGPAPGESEQLRQPFSNSISDPKSGKSGPSGASCISWAGERWPTSSATISTSAF